MFLDIGIFKVVFTLVIALAFILGASSDDDEFQNMISSFFGVLIGTGMISLVVIIIITLIKAITF